MKAVQIVFIIGILGIVAFANECKTTKDEPCIFPMTYKGESVSMCIKSGNRYWCGTELKANNQYKKWGWCNDDCPNPDKAGTTTSAPVPSDSDCVTDDNNKPCIFPFKYQGKEHNSCIVSNKNFWCATELKSNGNYKKWANCGENCPRECAKPQFVGDAYCNDYNNYEDCNFDGGDCCGGSKKYCSECKCKNPSDSDSECKTVDGDTCKFPFEYKGKTYNNCTKTDSSNFWCATYTLEGEYVPGLFGECADNCTKECGLPEYKDDEFCNDENNFEGCNFDGGACCGSDVKKNYCTDCKCLDPNAEDCKCDVIELTIENDPAQIQGGRAGTYEISSEKVNGKNQWIGEASTIWWNPDKNRWTISSTVGSGGGIFGPSESNCADEVGSNWLYFDGSSEKAAGNDIQVKCAPDSCQTACGYQCKFPFLYKNEEFNGCTTRDNGGEYWCATQLNLTSDSKQWGPCSGICPIVDDNQDRQFIRPRTGAAKKIKIDPTLSILYKKKKKETDAEKKKFDDWIADHCLNIEFGSTNTPKNRPEFIPEVVRKFKEVTFNDPGYTVDKKHSLDHVLSWDYIQKYVCTYFVVYREMDSTESDCKDSSKDTYLELIRSDLDQLIEKIFEVDTKAIVYTTYDKNMKEIKFNNGKDYAHSALLNHKPTLTGSDGKKLNEINQEIKDDAKAALNNIKYGQSNDDNAMHIKTLLTKLSSAPANLRYGDAKENSAIQNKLDPMSLKESKKEQGYLDNLEGLFGLDTSDILIMKTANGQEYYRSSTGKEKFGNEFYSKLK